MSPRERFTRIINDIKQTSQKLEDESPDWTSVSAFKLVGVVKEYAIQNFNAARLIFDRKVSALENLQAQIDELRQELKGEKQ
ncbi:hypothetical protein [Vibrio coralliilyticus]|uniref:hypothetical protein n=1 Tax=Vibrio coralliilyticus TaxID=190893 RepID=UPI002FCFB770